MTEVQKQAIKEFEAVIGQRFSKVRRGPPPEYHKWLRTTPKDKRIKRSMNADGVVVISPANNIQQEFSTEGHETIEEAFAALKGKVEPTIAGKSKGTLWWMDGPDCGQFNGQWKTYCCFAITEPTRHN